MSDIKELMVIFILLNIKIKLIIIHGLGPNALKLRLSNGSQRYKGGTIAV